MNNKWIAISLGSLIGLSHIGMIGMISRQQKFPVVNVPVGPYTSYSVEANKEGYKIMYRANDPKVMHVERDIKEKGGFLGLGNNTSKVTQQYTMDGSQHLRNIGTAITENAKSEACIEAIGSGKGTGKMVGAGVGAAVAPSLTGIPFVGWVLAGAATMIGMDQGSEIGGTMARDLSKEC
tara:strand:+ start:375 stop:911 length:537 start_codon:yes stop_codon:yes gene_type:complete